MTDIIKLLITDDHPVVRDGLVTIISTEPDLEVVDVATNGIEAIQKAMDVKPDVILMDLVMPRKDGVDAITGILRNDPQAKILVLTGYGDNRKIVQSVQAGAKGFILKDSPPEELLEAIRKVYRNEPVMQGQVLSTLLNGIKSGSEAHVPLQRLTIRELEILKLVARGNKNSDVAKFLYISERTVTKHVSNILDKLQLSNRTQLAFYAAKEGLLEESK